LIRKLIALEFSQKVLNFRKIYTPKFLGCYRELTRAVRGKWAAPGGANPPAGAPPVVRH
jgi:hypothetical protein